MRVRKIILVVLLLFAVASLLIIAYSAKNKMGMFGKFYDTYVKEQTALASVTVKSNLDSIFNEVKPLSEDNAVKSVFIASSLGEPADRFVEDFTRIKDALGQCRKIQAFDTEGRVIFSTSADEINSQKMKSAIMQKVKEYFRMNNGLFVYFVGTNEFVSIYPIAQETVHGYVAVYYDNQRLLRGMPKNKMNVPFSFDNYMFLTAKSVEKNDVSKIVDYYSGPESSKTNASQKNQTVGGIAQFNGLKLVYYAKNDKYIPFWTLLILILDLFLLGAIIFTLIQMFLEKKMYQKVRLSSFDRETGPSAMPTFKDDRDTEIEDLVTDIEKGRPYGEKVAEKGIEDMILTSNVNLTEDEPVAMAEEDERIALEPGELLELEQKEKIELPDFDFKIDRPDSFKQKSSADLFAEQERILDGVDNKAFEDESLSFEIPAGLKNVPEIDLETPGLEATPQTGIVETPDLQLSSDLEELESIKPAPETVAENLPPEINLEEAVPSIQAEDDGLDYKPTKFAADEDLTISLGESPDDVNLMNRPRTEDDIVLSLDTSESVSDKEEVLSDITPSEELVSLEEVPPVPVFQKEIVPQPEPVQVLEETPIPENESLQTEKTPAVVSLSPKEYEMRMKNVFVEPPVRLSCIRTVEDYGKAAIDIAKKSLNINKVLVLEKKVGGFKTILNKGFSNKEFGLDLEDPVYKLFLSQKKSLDISGDLKESRYLQERFNSKDISGIEEFFIMPIVNKENIDGIAVFARDAGTPAPTNFQRSELFNLGFLQEC